MYPSALTMSPDGRLAVIDNGSGNTLPFAIRFLANSFVRTALYGTGGASIDGADLDPATSSNNAQAMAFDSIGNLWLAEANGFRRYDVSGLVTTLQLLDARVATGATAALFNLTSVVAMAIGPNGTIFVSPSGVQKIYRIK